MTNSNKHINNYNIVKTIITTINSKTLEPSKVTSNKNEMLLKVVNWMVHGTIKQKIKIN